jgi:hypothetical protein
MMADALRVGTRAAFIGCALASVFACKSKPASAASTTVAASDSTTGSARSDARDACSLVTRAEMEEVLGKPVDPPTNGEDGDKSRCNYSIPGSATAVGIEVTWGGGDASWAGVKAGKNLLDKTGSEAGLGPMEEPIPNLGDDAFIQSVKMPKVQLPANTGLDISSLGGGQGVLWMRKGADIVEITIANQEDAKEKGIAIARKALGRL